MVTTLEMAALDITDILMIEKGTQAEVCVKFYFGFVSKLNSN